MEGDISISCLSVCEAIAKESRKISHLCQDTVVSCNQCKTKKTVKLSSYTCPGAPRLGQVQNFILASDTLRCAFKDTFGDGKLLQW